MPSEFDRYAETYDDVLSEAVGNACDIDRFAGYKVDEVAHRLRNVSVRRILDFGCGTGRSLSFLASAFPAAEVFGYDPSEQCASLARSRCTRAHVSTCLADIRASEFDCVFAANVFHHIPIHQRPDAVAQCAQALRPGGSLFIFEHNPYNPVTRWIFDRCPFDSNASMLARKETIALGRMAGLQLARKAYTLFFPFRGKTWSALQRLLCAVPLGAQYYVQFSK
jgi:2-polyprenyl-3-methyl-5-hydroxy-6-metoxy-1,4-benzoquinol methylase